MTTSTLLLSTTGTAPQVIIPSLGEATFIHPVTNIDLFEEFGKDEVVRDATVIAELNAAVAAGTITISDSADSSNVTDVSAASLVDYSQISGAPDPVSASDDSIVVGASQDVAVNLDTTTVGNQLVLTPGEGLYIPQGAGLNSTTDLPEGTNLYYTDARVDNQSNVSANTASRHEEASAEDDSVVVGDGLTQTIRVNIDSTTPGNLLTLTPGEGLYVASSKFGWLWDVAIDANVNTNRRAMDRLKNMPTTDNPFIAPVDSQIIRVVASNVPSAPTELWTLEIELDGVVSYTLNVTGGSTIDILATALAVPAGTEVTMFFNQNGTGNVRFPAASVYLIDA